LLSFHGRARARYPPFSQNRTDPSSQELERLCHP
jgi:hypothetical protein